MITVPPDPEAVKEAIRLRCANCFSAMRIANALGGSRTPAWELAHNYSLKRLLDHAQETKIDLSGLLSAVDNIPIEQSIYYRYAMGTISDEEFDEEVRKWKRGK